ncbi:ATP-binding cassette domain-containing protein [Treponema denticola]|uniref:ATP-binding cassette domain-containing protein n=1 Tax=Treponema denticola TaxID=158 RepID=UPI002106B329|nr:ATP-binding cassette domain-containing protein [Treponema denticola]
MGEIFDLKKEIADEGYWIKPEKILGNIEIKDLIFRYGTRKPVLNKISLNINAGESIGFVGASGSGKTSLIKLLLKFYSPESGSIKIDGHNIEELKAELIISDKDIAELKIGMEVNLKFTALPPSEYGVLKGVITNISNDSFNNQNTSSFFLVDTDILSSSLKNNEQKEVKLKPGMSTEAHIIIKRKTIIKFILEKLDFVK